MNKRIISMLIVVCMLVPILATYNLPALAAEGDLPTTLWVDPANGNGIPARIVLNSASSSSGGGGGCGGYPGGGGSSSGGYQLYLPGNADPAECYFSWDDGLMASDGTSTYASGALPIPAPGETKTFTFTKGSSSATFQVTTYQGSREVPPIFVQIDESQGTISAMNNDDDHEATCTGTIFVDGVEYAMPTIKGRGNSSWMMARTKKPYNVTLDTKVNLLGIDSEKTKKWSFLANSNERSLLRNKLGYDMAHAMGIGLDSAQADVWMNGKYLGTYLVTPKYDSFVPKDGFMIENDNYKEDPVEQGGDPSFDLEGLIGQGSSMQYYNYNRITVKKVGDNLLGEETAENLKAAGEMLRVYTQEVWDAIRSADGYNAQGNYYADYIDMRSWAAMYLMQDYIKNYDFCGGSLFFHREGQTEANKLFAGPLWDLDIGFGCPENSPTLGRNLDLLDGTGWFVRNVSDTKTSIYKVVGKHADFMEEVSRVYNIYHSVFDNAPAHLEEMAQSIRASAEMNDVVTANEQQPTVRISRQTVKQQGTKYEQTYKVTNTWRDYVDNVKTYATARSAFFRDNLYDESQAGYSALFQLGANSGVTVFDTQDLSGEGTDDPEAAYARSADTGEIDMTGEGQINFRVNLKSGYRIKSVSVEPAENYKNLKGPADTGAENVYRVTKITGPLTVKVEVEEIVCEHEFVDGVCVKCGAAAIQVRFVCAEGVTIDVYKTQAEDSEVLTDVTAAFPRSSASGEVDITGEGQVNFVVNVADGYQLESVAAEPSANFKNLKGPEETLKNNGYRVTKLTGDVTVTVNASKTEPGSCAHEYQAVATAPTCTSQGYITHTCAKCGDSYQSDFTAKIAHDYQNGACTVCGEKLLNMTISVGEGASVTVFQTQKADGPKAENAANANPRDGDTGLIDCSGEGQVNFQVVLADGYELESVAAEPAGSYKNLKGPADTGIANGYRITKVKGDFTLTVRAVKTGPQPCEHDYEAVVTAPTCTEKGHTTYTCTKCGDSYVGDEVAALGHDYRAVVTAPTCTAGGYTTYTCARCGDSYTDTQTAALGHDWDEGVITKQPTETAKGERTYTCKRCGEKRTEAIPELAHVHRYTEVVTAPTCTEEGFTTHTCACGDSYVDAEVLALGHDYQAVGPAPVPTCASFTTIVYKCTRCGDTIEEEIAPMPHDYKAVVTAPTCTEAGFTTYTCSRCGDSYQAGETAALGHSFGDWAVSKAPTCTEKGEETRACARCDAKETREIAAPGHDYKAVVTAPTCTEAGYTTYTCSRCGDSYKADETAALGHDFEVEDIAPTCTTPGSRTFTCRNCGIVSKANGLPPLGHDYVNGVCTRCGNVAFRFDDVQNPDDYFFAPVYWAYEHEPQITNGTSATLFSPDAGCTRAQVVTFLWRAMGKPEPTKTETPFNDVAKGQYYYDAVLWAVEEGVTTGTSADKFSPDSTCTRGQIVTFLWRAMEKPAPKNTNNPFTDVPAGAYYTDAVLWAVESGVTRGTSENRFSPDSTCTRGQIVTFLWRALPERAD